MRLIDDLIGSVTAKATDAATAAAADAAAAQWAIYRPYAILLAFLALTVYLFFFLPRFASPWRKIN